VREGLTQSPLTQSEQERFALRFAEAHLLHEEERHSASLNEARKLAELLMWALWRSSERAAGREVSEALPTEGAPSLVRAANTLYKRGELPKEIAAAISGLQPLGNLGSHDLDASLTTLSASTEASLAMTRSLGVWLCNTQALSPTELQAPRLLPEARQARWRALFERSCAIGSSAFPRAQERGGGRFTLALITLFLGSTLLIMWLMKPQYQLQTAPQTAPQKTTSIAPSKAPSPLKLSVTFNPERELLTLGEVVRVSLSASEPTPHPLTALRSLHIEGQALRAFGDQVRAVSTGRALVKVCGPAQVGCAERAVLVVGF
jgi:hypothetical protein